LNGTRHPVDSDLNKLSRLKALSWLSASEMGLLAAALALTNFKRPQIILREGELAADAHILLQGVARITCRNARGERATIALLAPGPIPEFPSLSFSRFDFRCEAYNDCRIGSVSWSNFEGIAAHRSASVFKTFHLGLHERIAITLLELASDFGIQESRGALLRVSFSHQDIADLVGASRPRVTEHLAQLEREQLVIRQGRQLIVRIDEIGNAMGSLSNGLGASIFPLRKESHPFTH
jgi:CRP-like cAMP-binding protein